MEVIDAINNRCSVRHFSKRIPQEHQVDELLEAATRAPNAGNLQPWFFTVVWNRDIKRQLAGAALGQKHVEAAPVVVIISVNPELSGRQYGDRGRQLYCIQDGAAAAENLLLAAVDKGLGGCWVGAFDERKVALIIDAPSGYRPTVMVPLGYPAGPLRLASRNSVERISVQLK
jgi:nitroreductase